MSLTDVKIRLTFLYSISSQDMILIFISTPMFNAYSTTLINKKFWKAFKVLLTTNQHSTLSWFIQCFTVLISNDWVLSFLFFKLHFKIFTETFLNFFFLSRKLKKIPLCPLIQAVFSLRPYLLGGKLLNH